MIDPDMVEQWFEIGFNEYDGSVSRGLFLAASVSRRAHAVARRCVASVDWLRVAR